MGKKKDYRFVISDEEVNSFFDAQSNKSLSFRLIVYDAIDKYGKNDVIETILINRRKEGASNE